MWDVPFNCRSAIVQILSDTLHLFDIICKRDVMFVMVALWNKADHYIFMLWVVLLLLLFLFPRLISAAAKWMSAILPHMVWP